MPINFVFNYDVFILHQTVVLSVEMDHGSEIPSHSMADVRLLCHYDVSVNLGARRKSMDISINKCKLHFDHCLLSLCSSKYYHVLY